MTQDEMMFFEGHSNLLPLYETLKSRVDGSIKVSKTQISLYDRHMFAMVSLPIRRKKDWPKEFLMVSFGLAYPLESTRIAAKVEPYPNRWTHHVTVEKASEIDDELLGWIREARAFAAAKR